MAAGRCGGRGGGALRDLLQHLAGQAGDFRQALAHQGAQVVAGDLVDQWRGQGHQVRLAFQRAWVGFFAELLEEVVGQRLGVLVDAGAEGIGALAAYQGVRVFAFGQEQEARAAAVLQVGQGGFQGAPGRLAPGGVAVEAEQHAGHQAEQALEVLLAGRRAKGRHRVAQALLGQGDDVHVALDHHDLIEVAIVLARLVQAVQLLPLVEHGGFGGVEVLRLVVAEHAAAEGDDAAAAVADGEHHAVAEAVVDAAVLGVLDQQAGIDHGFLLQLVAGHVLVQVVPARRGEAQAEVAGNLAGQAAALEVVHGRLARRVALQGLAVVVGGGRQQRVER